MYREKPPEKINMLDNELLISRLHEKIARKKSFYQPNPEDFKGEEGYSEESIDEEIARVSSYKEKWAREKDPQLEKHKKLADIVEGIIVDQFSGSWLSEKATGHYTAEVDDVLRGIDVVAEITDEEERHYLGFAIDVTIAKDSGVVDKKLERIWEDDIKKGKLPEVQYLETDHYKGKMQLPRVVIGVNPDFANELVGLENKNDKKSLAEHPFQTHLIWQIKEQLESYYRYAQLANNPKFLEKITESLRIFYKLIKEKEEMLIKTQSYVEGERYYQNIKSFCEREIERAKKFFDKE